MLFACCNILFVHARCDNLLGINNYIDQYIEHVQRAFHTKLFVTLTGVLVAAYEAFEIVNPSMNHSQNQFHPFASASLEWISIILSSSTPKLCHQNSSNFWLFYVLFKNTKKLWKSNKLIQKNPNRIYDFEIANLLSILRQIWDNFWLFQLYTDIYFKDFYEVEKHLLDNSSHSVYTYQFCYVGELNRYKVLPDFQGNLICTSSP